MISDAAVPEGLSETDYLYARLLYASGIPIPAIEQVVRSAPRVIVKYVEAQRWERRTPRRPDAVVGLSLPVRVRCPECGAQYGDVLRRPPRPCPRCGRERLVLL